MAPACEPWLQTYTGLHLDLLDPQPEQIHWADIAVGLGREHRYAGQTRAAYTVAQHTLLVVAILREQGHDDCLTHGLLHDASEAYLKDIPSPLKVLLPEYVCLERRLTHAITAKFGVPYAGEWPDPVKRADALALRAEAWVKLNHPPLHDWAGPPEEAVLPGPRSNAALYSRGTAVDWQAALTSAAHDVGLL